MIRLIAIAGFALAVASSADAMTAAPIHQPEGMMTQVAYGCGPGRTRVGGVCVARITIRHARRAAQVCILARRRLPSVVLLSIHAALLSAWPVLSVTTKQASNSPRQSRAAGSDVRAFNISILSRLSPFPFAGLPVVAGD
jgi:hypothetical protein